MKGGKIALTITTNRYKLAICMTTCLILLMYNRQIGTHERSIMKQCDIRKMFC
jgi:hypothetical protein